MSIEENTGCCRECGAEVVWAFDAFDVKRPIDVKTVQVVSLLVDDGALRAMYVDAHVPHVCDPSESGRLT